VIVGEHWHLVCQSQEHNPARQDLSVTSTVGPHVLAERVFWCSCGYRAVVPNPGPGAMHI